MTLQQLRYFVEVVRQGLSVSGAAKALRTSQPGISKQLALLEEELQVALFERHGRRFLALTEPGTAVLELAERMLLDAHAMTRVRDSLQQAESGSLVVATTHTQARYVLPAIVTEFRRRFPGVRLGLRQGSPTQVCEDVLAGRADLAIATEAISDSGDLVMLPCYRWNRSIIAPRSHPILRCSPLTLEQVAAEPIVTYDFAFTGRSQINTAFAARGLEPRVVLTAIDADIIKTYVALGLGVGIIASMAFEPSRDLELGAVDASHLFPDAVTRIGIRQGAWLRGFAYAFIELFAPSLDRRTVDAALRVGS